MAGLRFDISMSLDGFVAGPNQSEENPLGEGGEQLHEWVVGLEAWRKPHGHEGGEVNASTAVVEESLENLGATMMGRNMFGGDGPWGEEPWDGWWGDEPPFHVPVFVLTHKPRPAITMAGGTTFRFLDASPGAVLERANHEAGDEDVRIGGGATVVRNFLRAGLVDQLHVAIAPILLGRGIRLWDDLRGLESDYTVKTETAPSGTIHVTFRR